MNYGDTWQGYAAKLPPHIKVRAPNMDAENKFRSIIQEDVARLYLRLNGFFVTGFISHSPNYGRVLTEIDALGVRMPYSSEPERKITTHDFLGVSAHTTELVICEVKSRREQLRFNEALSANENACASVLRWAGLFSEKELPAVVSGIQALLQKRPLSSNEPPTVSGPRGARVRCLLFSLEKSTRRENQPWFVSGPDAFGYIFDCLCPLEQRPSCSTTYDYNQWREFASIVNYFKNRMASDAGDIEQLYSALRRSNNTPERTR